LKTKTIAFVGARRIFPWVGKLGGLETENGRSPTGSSGGAQMEVWGQNPQKLTTSFEENNA